MYSYSVYGLKISSVIQLPQLQHSYDNSPDVFIELEPISQKPELKEGEYSTIWANEYQSCAVVRDVGAFQIIDGKQIIVDPIENSKQTELQHVLLGIVISILLYQRGYLILHCSVVEKDGIAIGFLGNSGDGKSSIATVLIEQGYKMVSDDLAVIELNSNTEAIVYAGFAQTKLHPEVAERIGIDPQSLKFISENEAKETLSLKDDFTNYSSLPLRSLFVLTVDNEVTITDLNGHKGVMSLVSYSFDIYLAKAIDELGLHFKQCTQLAKQVSVKKLSRPWNLDYMSDIILAIDTDINSTQKT